MEQGRLTVPPTDQAPSGSSSEGYSSSSVSHQTTPRIGGGLVCDGGVEMDGRGSASGLTRPGQLSYHSPYGAGGGGVSPQGSRNIGSPSSPQTHHSRQSGLSGTPTPPTPVPRTIKLKQLEDENSRLRAELALLRQRNDDLTKQSESGLAGQDDNTTALRARVSQLVDQIEKMKTANSLNVERLTEKISTLELGGMASDQTIEKLTQRLRMEESEVERERTEKCQLEQSLSSLKVEFRRVEGEREIIERERNKLKEELKNSSSGDQLAPGQLARSNSVSERDQRLHRRLNDALRDRKQLDDKVTSLNLELNNLKADKETAEQEIRAKTHQLEEVHRENGRLREENEMVKQEQLKRAEQEKVSLQFELESTRSELRAAGEREAVEERELAALRERERQLTDYGSDMESRMAATDAELEQAKAHLGEVCSEKEALELKIQSLESAIEEAKSRHETERTSLLSRLEKAESSAEAAHKAQTTAVKQATALKQAKEKGDNICDELKKEAEFIMTDLEEANTRLVEAEQERDKLKHQKDKVMNELAKRNRDIEQKEELIKKLTQQVEGSKEQVALLDIQLQTYHADFESERRSREEMATKVEQLREELLLKDNEVKRLHTHLNKSAAMQMKAEMEEMEYLTSEDQEGVVHYATVRSHHPPDALIEDGQPVRARDPERTHPPQGGGHYQMHNPPRY